MKLWLLGKRKLWQLFFLNPFTSLIPTRFPTKLSQMHSCETHFTHWHDVQQKFPETGLELMNSSDKRTGFPGFDASLKSRLHNLERTWQKNYILKFFVLRFLLRDFCLSPCNCGEFAKNEKIALFELSGLLAVPYLLSSTFPSSALFPDRSSQVLTTNGKCWLRCRSRFRQILKESDDIFSDRFCWGFWIISLEKSISSPKLVITDCSVWTNGTQLATTGDDNCMMLTPNSRTEAQLTPEGNR